MKHNQVILSLDVATKTGYAIYKNGEVVESGVWHLDRHKRNTPTTPHQNLYGLLTATINKHGITQIITESVYVPKNKTKGEVIGYNATIALFEYRGVVKAVNEASGLADIVVWEAIRAKRDMFNYRYGMGRDECKQRMVTAVKRLGYDVETDDEADALGILFSYLGEKIHKQ